MSDLDISREAVERLAREYRNTAPVDVLHHWCMDAAATLRALLAERDRLVAALDRLARLGNEPHYGNSDGNRIAQQALGIKP